MCRVDFVLVHLDVELFSASSAWPGRWLWFAGDRGEVGDLCPISPGKLGWARPTNWPLGPFRNSSSPKQPCEEALKLLDVELAKPRAAVVHTNAGARMSWTPGPCQEGAPDTRPDGKKRVKGLVVYSVPFSTSTPLLDQIHHHDRSFFLFRPARHPVCDVVRKPGPPTRVIPFGNCPPALDHHT